MRKRIILVGRTEEPSIHFVSSKGLGRQHRKVNGQLIEFEKVPCYEELEEAELSNALLCMEQLDDVRLENMGHHGRGMIYMPRLAEWEMDTALFLLQQIPKRRHPAACLGVAAKGESIGGMLLELLTNFGIIQGKNDYRLFLGTPKELNMQELVSIEDVLLEYMNEDCTLYIEQIILEKTMQWSAILVC